MKAIEYVKSVPRYVAARYAGRTWRSLYTTRLGTVRLAEIDPPTMPGSAWARLRPVLSGICGSDLATIAAQGSPYFSPFTSTPFVFGHEVVAEVIEPGPEAGDFKAGDRVVLSPPLHCEVRGIIDRCEACARGQIGHCRNVTRGDISAGIQTGYCRDTGGGWSESFVAHRVQLFSVPNQMSDEAAVLIEPLSCCLSAALAVELGDDETALVLGCGTIGALTISALRSVGSRCRIVAVAKHPHQQEAAHRLGADEVVGTDRSERERMTGLLGSELFRPEIGAPVGLGGADACFDCVGSGTTLDDAMRFTRAMGTVIVVGMPGMPRGVDWTAMWHKELRIRGSYTATDATFRRAIEIMEDQDGLLSPLVGARFPLVDYQDALASAFDTGRSAVFKTVFG